ncbi:MAG: TolC family protein [Saprospiraceae bacterium]
MYKFIFSALLMLFGLNSITAQETSVLDQYLKEGMESNLALKQHQLDWEQSLEALNQARSLFRPQVQFNANYTRALGGRKIDFPIGDLLNPVYSTLNQLTQSNNFPSLENQQIQFLPDNFHETYVQLSYPIYNPGIQYNRKIKKVQSDLAEFSKESYENKLRMEIRDAYYNYLQASEAQAIWQNNKVLFEEVLRFNQSLVKNQLATKDAVETAVYQISQADQQIAELEAHKNNAAAYLNFLVNKPLDTPVSSQTQSVETPLTVYNVEQLQSEALGSRKELQVLAKGREASQLNSELQKAVKNRPELYLGVQAGYQGFGYTFDKEQAYALARVGLKYDLYTGGTRTSKMQEARIQEQQIQVQIQETQAGIQLQVWKAWQEMEAAKNKLLSAETGQKAADEILRIQNNKYKAGQSLLIELTEAQNRATNAQIQVLLSQIELLKKEAALLYAVGK